MNKQELINEIHEHARHGWGGDSQYECPGITKKEVNAVLYHLGKLVVERVLLKADKVNLPGLGQFHARWVESKLKPGETHLVAHFDYDAKAEARFFAAGGKP